jgi:DNA-binding CsgD family transcriptional regulator
MQVQPIRLGPPTADVLRREVAPLLDSLGTPAFESRLFAVAHQLTRCEHLSAFVSCKAEPPRLLLAANSGAQPVARSAGSTYLMRFWHLDPVNQLPADDARLGLGILVQLGPRDMRALAYRRACYNRDSWNRSGANLIDRLSLLARHDGRTLRINFYRHRDAGPFDGEDLGRIAAASDLLIALLRRHDAAAALPEVEASFQSYWQRLRALAPQLPRRECEVCAGVALGLSSERIALKLGIGLNTVLTYRKRAYARLNISSQNQLLTLIYCAARR